MYCKDCGEQIPDDSVFCPECGAKLTVAPAAAAPPSASTPPPASPTAGAASQDVGQGLFIGLILASLFIPLIGIIMGVIYMRDPSAAKKKAGKVWLWVGIGASLFWLFMSMGGGDF
jgi:hypothetical protein